MKSKSIISLIILMSMISTMASCGGSETSDDSTKSTESITGSETVSSETGRDAVSDDLPEKNYGGATFTILDRTKYSYEFKADEETGDLLNDAIYKRNVNVEDRFGIELKTHTLDSSWGAEATAFNNTLRSSIMAGDGAFDLVAGYAAVIPSLVSDGIFLNWMDLDYVDFSKPWWSEAVAEELTINGKSFMVTGDLSLALWKGMTCLFFNKNLADSYGIEDLYDTVKQGAWTFDKLIEYTKDVYQDLNGDSTSSEEDLYGLLCYRDTEIDNMKEAFELFVTQKGADGFPELVFKNERTVEIVQRLNSFIHDSEGVYFPDESAGSSRVKMAAMFSEGRGVFFTSTLGVSENLRAMDDDFGIIPYPKYDSNQKTYHSTSLDEFSLFLIPVDVKDKEMSAMITEALCAESYKNVVPTFYDTALKTKAARDEDSSEMIDIIRDGLIFDFGYLHSNSLGGVGHRFVNLIRANNNDVVSDYDANASTYETKLETVLEIYR